MLPETALLHCRWIFYIHYRDHRRFGDEYYSSNNRLGWNSQLFFALGRSLSQRECHVKVETFFPNIFSFDIDSHYYKAETEYMPSEPLARKTEWMHIEIHWHFLYLLTF